jgi:hypothetical protein
MDRTRRFHRGLSNGRIRRILAVGGCPGWACGIARRFASHTVSLILFDQDGRGIFCGMPTIEFTDGELAAVAPAIHRTAKDDRLPPSPRLAPLKLALAKLVPNSAKPAVERAPLPSGPMVGSWRKARR